MVDTELPYLPDIMRGVVARVDAVFSDTIRQDSFNVFFEAGIYSQVGRAVYKSSETYPLVWLVMKFTEDRGSNFAIYADVTCQIIIAMPTDKDYTQEQRYEEVFKTRLIPIYAELMRQIAEEPAFAESSVNKIKHTRILQPYWGGGDVGGPDAKNLFDNYIDAISIQNLQLQLKHYSPC